MLSVYPDGIDPQSGCVGREVFPLLRRYGVQFPSAEAGNTHIFLPAGGDVSQGGSEH